MKRILFYLLILIALPWSMRAQGAEWDVTCGEPYHYKPPDTTNGPYFHDPIIDIDTVTGITRLGVPFEDTIWITDPLLCPIAL